MTSHRDSHTITDVKPEMIPGVQTGNGIPHDKHNICNIAYVRTERKDDIYYQGGIKFEISWEPNFPVKNFARNNREKTRHFSTSQ